MMLADHDHDHDHDLDRALRALDAADPAPPAPDRTDAVLHRVLASGRPVSLPQRSRPAARRAVPVAVAAAAVGAGNLVLPAMTGGDAAFATWTAAPGSLPPAQRTAAVASCRDRQAEGPSKGQYSAELKAARPVIAEARGVWTTVILATGDGYSFSCTTDSSKRLFTTWFGSAGRRTDWAPPAPRELVALALGSGGGTGDRAVSMVQGEAGQDVRAVALATRTHGLVRATVSGGWFSLWFPGEELQDSSSRTGVTVQVTYRDGRTGRVTLRL